MRNIWRIVTERYAGTAFSGDGARRYGGRWNPKGVPVVYTAESQALAVLEMLVQDEPLRARYAVIRATLPETIAIKQLTIDQLPVDWRSPEARTDLRARGAAWITEAKTAVLVVPSAVIPEEKNFLLNPFHPDFLHIQVGPPQPLVLDERLLKSFPNSER